MIAHYDPFDVDPARARETRTRIQVHEGCDLIGYKDTRGLWTIGFGHLCADQSGPPKPIDMPAAEALFDADLIAARAIWRRLAEAHEITPAPGAEDIAGVGIEMCFQMGNRVEGFRGFLGALARREYPLAAVEMLDSAWHAQTPGRAVRLAKIVAMAPRGGA